MNLCDISGSENYNCLDGFHYLMNLTTAIISAHLLDVNSIAPFLNIRVQQFLIKKGFTHFETNLWWKMDKTIILMIQSQSFHFKKKGFLILRIQYIFANF